MDALSLAGVRVEEAHVPVFERVGDKSRPGMLALTALLLRLIIAYVRLVPEVALRLLRCDALLVGYIGQMDAIVLGPVARLMGRPLIFNPLVTLTDTLVEDRKRVPPGSPQARVVAAIDRLALRSATLILIDTEENARYLHERFGIERSRIVVVPVGADESIFFPRPGQTNQPARDTLDVLFVGKFIPLHGIETILQAVAILERQQVQARVEIVGRGQTYEAMRALARELGLRTVVWTDWIPFDHLGERLRRADIALGVFDDGAKAGRVIPNKVYQSLACGVATITRRSPAIESVLHDGKSALLVPPSDPEALASAILRLTDAATRERVAKDGHRAFVRHGSRSALSQKLRPVLDVIERSRERG